ncbi:hypothetical protein [Actinomadura sp. 21ATH]|uniref:hypothetical protein n=1 Tax=Actinomadura sp. 21ATH TaxID=1735444 RepID=UPI0035BF78AC
MSQQPVTAEDVAAALAVSAELREATRDTLRRAAEICAQSRRLRQQAAQTRAQTRRHR